MAAKEILVIDETIREGMQHRGLMFSSDQRRQILEFQEKLGVDICQAGYPPAHSCEADAVRTLCRQAKKNRFKIRVAAMGRAVIPDAAILLDTGVNDLHFHLQIKKDGTPAQLDNLLAGLSSTIDFVRKKAPKAVLSIAMLDIGRLDDPILRQCLSFLTGLNIDILSLPDTSGMMSPNQVFEKIKTLSSVTGNISIHCHNDMGMASANSVMGILAGGRILEASALGLGERNGIADLFTTVKTLKNLGVHARLNTDDTDTFNAYYEFVDAIVYEQTGDHVLTFNTPVFGDAVKTHVAGTHAAGGYGLAREERFFLNVLCGKHLVKKYLDSHNMACPLDLLDILTRDIKSKSAELNRSLMPCDLKKLVASLTR